MDREKLTLLISKTIKPKASLSSLLICLTPLCKTDPDGAYIFMQALCDQDISKAAQAAARLTGDFAPRGQALVATTLRTRCETGEDFSCETLLAILDTGDRELFRLAAPRLTGTLIIQAFSRCTAQSACALMELILRYADADLQGLCRDAFCAFLNRYDSSGDEALTKLLPALLENNAVDILSKLLDTLGLQKLETIYDPDWFLELDRLIVSGYDSLELWDAYFECIFRGELSADALFSKGLWQIQLFCNEDLLDKVAACFYLHAASHLPPDHEIFLYADAFSPSNEFSRKHTLRYQDALQPLWDQPEALVRFLDITAICNPFYWQVIQEERFTLIRDVQDNLDYSRLSSFFEKGVDCKTILKLFLYTGLKNSLPMEDLLYLCRRYDVLTQMLEELKDMPFHGVVRKHKPGLMVVSPKAYNVMSLHSLHLPFSMMQHTKGKTEDKKGKTVSYTIIGFLNGHIQVNAVAEETKTKSLPEAGAWEAAVDYLEYWIQLPDDRKNTTDQLNKLPLLAFSLESMKAENDLDLLSELIQKYPEKLAAFTWVLRYCKWNSLFISPDTGIPGHFYQDFSKYNQRAMALFEELVRAEVPCKLILRFYFSSIYKILVPLNLLLAMMDKSEVMEVVEKYTVYCRVHNSMFNLCRPINILCAPLCELEVEKDVVLPPSFSTVIRDYDIIDGIISHISLQSTYSPTLPLKDRGALFGYLAMNEHIGAQKQKNIRRLPDVEQYTSRELLFNLQCMEEAILLRRSKGPELMMLLQIMDQKNPFTFQISSRAEVNYLGRLYSEDRKQNIVSATSSMILNAPDLPAIRSIYLNTSAKYYLHLQEFAQLVQQRRPEFLEEVCDMFAGIPFRGTCDKNGFLWLPYVAQSTVFVGIEFAGMYLTCDLQLTGSGVTAQVLSVESSDDAVDSILLCLMNGYRLHGAMEPLLAKAMTDLGVADGSKSAVNRILHDTYSLRHWASRIIGRHTAPTPQGEGKTELMNQQMQMIRQRLAEQNHDPAFLRKQIRNMITDCYTGVNVEEMEAAIAELSESLMQHIPRAEVIIPFLREVFSTYSYRFRDNGLVYIWIDQLDRYLGSDVAAEFKKTMLQSARFLRNL